MGHRTGDDSDDTRNTFSFNGKTRAENDLGPFIEIGLTVVPKRQIFLNRAFKAAQRSLYHKYKQFLERFGNFILISGWWTSLHDLSKPQWRPPTDRLQSSVLQFDVAGKALVPAAKTLESVGAGFAAASVRWWQVRGKRPIRMLQSWRETEDQELATRSTIRRGNASKIQRLVELAADQQQPIWVEGGTDSTEKAGDSSSHSTHPRMFTWLVASKSRRGVLEVVFDSDRNGLDGRDREIYLRALHLLREDLHRNMIAVPEPLPVSPLSFLENAQSHPRAEQSAATSIAALAELSFILDTTRRETIQKIESHLASLEGARLDSLQSNQMLAKSLQQLLDSHGFRIRCPECGEPAIMRCLAAGNSHTGSFVFDHVLLHGRTFHGGRSSVPKLEVVAKPVRQGFPT